MTHDDGISRFPFQPNNPVDPHFFVGRKEQREKIRRFAEIGFRNRNVRIIYLSGLRGIGKTSLAHVSRRLLEKEFSAWGFPVFLGAKEGPKTLDALMQKVLRSFLDAKSDEASLLDKFQESFSHLTFGFTLGGFSVKQKDSSDAAPRDASQMVSFFAKLGSKLYEEQNNGLVLIFDEIDGVASEPFFAEFLKELVEKGAISEKTFPLVILLCGTRDRFDAITRNYRRAIDLVELDPLSNAEVLEFFRKAFNSIHVTYTESGLDVLTSFCGGLPHIMHLIGQTVPEIEYRNVIDKATALRYSNAAAAEWGSRFCDPKLLAVFDECTRTLQWLCNPNVHLSFSRADIINDVGQDYGDEVDACLKRLQTFGVIDESDEGGSWRFVNPLASLYLHNIGLSKGLIKLPSAALSLP